LNGEFGFGKWPVSTIDMEGRKFPLLSYIHILNSFPFGSAAGGIIDIRLYRKIGLCVCFRDFFCWFFSKGFARSGNEDDGYRIVLDLLARDALMT